MRLLTYVEGVPMTGRGYFAPVTARQFGALAGQVCAALAAFSHPGADLPNQWDVRRSPQVVADLLPALDPDLGARVRRLSAQSQRALEGSAPDLPTQVIHADVTDFNVVADPGPDARLVPAGIIDFGDLMHTWRAAEAAVTICALLVKDPRAPLRIAEDVLGGFLETQPLTSVEVEALWPMVAARACAGLVSTAHQLGSEPDNPYLHDNLAVDRAVFEMVAALPMELGTLAMRRAAGLLEAPRAGAPGPHHGAPRPRRGHPDRPVHHVAAARRGGVDRSGTRARGGQVGRGRREPALGGDRLRTTARSPQPHRQPGGTGDHPPRTGRGAAAWQPGRRPVAGPADPG